MRKIASWMILALSPLMVLAQTPTLSGSTGTTVTAVSSQKAKFTWTAPAQCVTAATPTCTYQVLMRSGACPAIVGGSTGWTVKDVTAATGSSNPGDTLAPAPVGDNSFVVEAMLGTQVGPPSNCVELNPLGAPANLTGTTE